MYVKHVYLVSNSWYSNAVSSVTSKLFTETTCAHLSILYLIVAMAYLAGYASFTLVTCHQISSLTIEFVNG